jgi:hypothetical protein
MSKLGRAILAIVEESAWAGLIKDGELLISTSNLFKAAANAGASYQEAHDYATTLGVWILP